MSKKIRRYSVLALFCSAVVLLLSLLVFHTTDSAFAQTYYRSFTVSSASDTGAQPHAATDGYGSIYVTYEETASVDFRKSMNSGASFSDPAVNVGSGVGYFPRIAINNLEEAYVVYSFQQGGNYYPRVSKSMHNGAYSFTMKLDAANLPVPAYYQGAKSLSQNDIRVEVISGVDNVYAVSEDDSTDAGGFWHIYFWRSVDGGANWGYYDFTPASAADPISTLPDARYPVLAVNGNGSEDVYAAWVRLGNDIMINYSDDKGENWSGEIAINGGASGSVQSQRPGLAASETGGEKWFFVNWCGSVSGINNVYFAFASEGGDAGTDQLLGNTSYHSSSQDQPSIASCVDSNSKLHLYAAWRDTRDSAPHIYFQEGIWTGSAFKWGIDLNADGDLDDPDEEGDDLRVNASSSGAEDTPTVIASSNGEVYVTWREDGAGIKCARYTLVEEEEVPGPPTDLVASAGNGRVDLEWLAPTPAEAHGHVIYDYYIYRSPVIGGPYTKIGSVGNPTRTYADTGLTNGTLYCYVVTAIYDSMGGSESGYSNEACETPEKQPGPTGLTADGGDRCVKLTWGPPPGGSVYDYKIYRGTHVGGPYGTLVATVGFNTFRYLDTGLSNGTKYCYVVTAIFDTWDGDESDYSNEACATANPASGTPSAPTNLTATAGVGTVSLGWDDNTEADLDYYNVYRSTTRGAWSLHYSTPAVGTCPDTQPAPSCLDSGSNGTCYWYVVTAVDTEGNESGYSNDVCATPNPDDTDAPGVPINLQASGGDGMVGLTWSPVSASDLDKYHVYRSVASDVVVGFNYIGEVTAPDVWFFDAGLTNGMTYYYVVTALDTSGNESGDSDEAVGIPRGAMGAGMGTAPGAPPILPEGGAGGGCFIATACYGSPLAGEVRVLSRFRDNCLLTNALGRGFVRAYYGLSPSIAGFIAEKPLLKSLVRIQLKPWVKIIKAVNSE